MQDQLIDILAVISGIVVIIISTGIAIRTFMVPTGAPPLINRVLFRFTQALFDAIIRPIRSEARRQEVLSLFAPVSLVVVLAVVLAMTLPSAVLLIQVPGAIRLRLLPRWVKLATRSTAVVKSRAPVEKVAAPKSPAQVAPTETTFELVAG